METYNPTKFREKHGACEFYWANQDLCDAALFTGVCIFTAVLLVVVA